MRISKEDAGKFNTRDFSGLTPMKSLDAREKMRVQFNAHLDSVDGRIPFNCEYVYTCRRIRRLAG